MSWQALVLFLVGPFSGVPSPPPAPEEARPRLLLLVTVDQARGDYLDRFRPALRGGLAMIHDGGVVFAEAHQHHAFTVTAPGHASLSTGLYPAHSGIVGNNFYDRTQGHWAYCVEDGGSDILPPDDGRRGWRGGPGRSPKQLLGTGLGDWIKRSIPAAKVFSVGGKDRSAVLMGGKDPDGAFWYDTRSGQWVSSRHYYEDYPDWVRAFHRRRPADAYVGSIWTPLEVEASTLERMEIHSTSVHTFPKALGRASLTPDTSFYDGLFSSPFIESYLLSFAEQLVVEEEIGADDTLDVLALSFSSVDTVGHEYGPNSRELLDAVMRLDVELGRFFRFLDERIGMSRIAIVLSADHGVAPFPGDDEAQAAAERATCFQRVGRAFEETFGADDWFVEPLHFDYETLERRQRSRSELESFLAEELAACPSVAKVWTRTEIENARAGAASGWLSETGELYSNSFHPTRSPDLYVQLEEFRLPSSGSTTHGSPYRYDTHVTAAVLWPGLEPGRIEETIATVDLPVTVAELLGVAAPAGLDGVDRSALIRGRRSPSRR